MSESHMYLVIYLDETQESCIGGELNTKTQ